MCIHAYLSPTDDKQPEGWPNPRAFMTERKAIAARMDEDGRRIAVEKGDCTVADLTRLGWLHVQVKAHQAQLASDWDRLDAEIAGAMATTTAIRSDHAPAGDHEIFLVDDMVVPLAPTVREPLLADEDIAFGIERAA